MFCGKCGTKLEDNVKFCPACGTPVQPEEPVAPVQQKEPVQEQPSAPVQEPVTPVQPEEPVMLAGDVAMPVEPEPVQSEMPVQPELPAQPEIPVQQTAPVQQEVPVQQMTPIQPAFAGVPETPVKKKKSKAGLIAGITAAAVVAGGAGVGYFGFHDDITRLFMGDKEYAKMIDKSTFKGAEQYESQSETYIKTASTSLGAFMKTAKETSDTEASRNSDDLRNKSTLIALNQITDTLERYALPEGMSLTSEASVNVQLGSVFALIDSDSTRKIIDAVNSSKFTARIANGETDMLSGTAEIAGEEFVNAAFYTKDGGMLITLPGITDKTVYIPKEEFDSVKISEEESKKYIPDMEELKRIRNDLIKIYYDSYDTAQITYTDASIMEVDFDKTENAVRVQGNRVSVTFTREQLEDMMDKCREYLKNDEYLRKYFNEAYGIGDETYDNTFRKPESSQDENKQNSTLTIEHIVDVHNNVLGTAYRFETEKDGTLKFRFVSDKNSKGFSAGYYDGNGDRKVLVQCVDTSENGRDGKAVLDILADINSGKDGSAETCNFRFNCDYTGKGKAKFIGDTEVPVGKYIITLSNPDTFEESLKSLLGSASDKLPDVMGNMSADTDGNDSGRSGNGFNPDSLIKELKKFTLTSEITVDGDVMNETMNISLGEIGSVEFGRRSEKKQETVEMPDKANSIKIGDADGMESLGEDLSAWTRDKLEKSGMTNAIGGVLGGALGGAIGSSLGQDIGSQNNSTNPHYAAYTEYMEYSADNMSSSIYQSLNDQVREILIRRGGDNTEHRIKLYYKNGYPEIIDNGGFSEFDPGYAAEADNVYAEILVDSRVSDGIVGVTTVFTDDRNDIPNELPGVFNYIDTAYPWENVNMIGDYVVGTYPYLYTGESTTTEYPAPLLTKEDLDLIAYNAAGKAFDLLDANGMAGKYIRSGSSDLGVEYFYDTYGWNLSGFYENGIWTGNELFSSEFTDELLGKCKELHEITGDTRAFRVRFFFKNGKLVGTAATSEEPYASLEWEGFPKTDDFEAGIFDGWFKDIGDGYIDYAGNVIPVGTYSVPASRSLVSSASAGASAQGAQSLGYDGTWRITAVNGQPYEEAVKEGFENISDQPDFDESDIPAFYIIINGNKMSVSIEGEDLDTAVITLEQGDYKGKPAYCLMQEGWEDPNGWFVPGETQGTAQLIDPDETLILDLVWESEVKTVSGNGYLFGEVKSDASIEEIAGKWYGTHDGDEYYLVIDTNYVAVEADDDDAYFSDTDFILLNPTEDGFDGFADRQGEAVTKITYSAETDTIMVSPANSDDARIFKRVETAPAITDYLGKWEVATIDGQTIETYAGQLGFEPEDVAFSFDIGRSTALYSDAFGSEVWTVIPVSGTEVTLAYDSSMFMKMKLSDDGTAMTGKISIDDSEETVEYTFRKVQ